MADVPGLVKVVRNGSFLGVVAEREERAIQAAKQLKATWNTPGQLPSVDQLGEYLRQQKTQDKSLVSVGDVDSALQTGDVQAASYTQPYQMLHLGRVVVAHDCGLIVNPNGLTNQIEGNVIQSASRTLLERVTFDDSRVTSVDWRSYPILRFADLPTIDVVLLNHPDQPAWGAGECATLTTGPAIANAIFWATGARTATSR